MGFSCWLVSLMTTVLWAVAPTAFASCPTTLTAEALLGRAIQAVEAMPVGFDTDRERRDKYLSKLVAGLADIGLTPRAAPLAASISSPPERALALGRMAASYAAMGEPTSAKSFLTRAVQTLRTRTPAERLETYKQLVTHLSHAGYSDGMRVVDALHLHLLRPGANTRSYSRYIDALTDSAARFAAHGLFAQAFERLETAEDAARKILGKPSSRASLLMRAALLQLEVDGLVKALETVRDIRRPSEHALALARLAEGLKAIGQQEALPSLLTMIRAKSREAGAVLWDRSSKKLTLATVADLQARLGDGSGRRETLAKAWELVATLPRHTDGQERWEQLQIELAISQALVEPPSLTEPPAVDPQSANSMLDAAIERVVSHFGPGTRCDLTSDRRSAIMRDSCGEALTTLLALVARSQPVERVVRLIQRLGIPTQGRDYTSLVRSIAVRLARDSAPGRARELWTRLHADRRSVPVEILIAETRAGQPITAARLAREAGGDRLNFEAVRALLDILQTAERHQERLIVLDAAAQRFTHTVHRWEGLRDSVRLIPHQVAFGQHDAALEVWEQVRASPVLRDAHRPLRYISDEILQAALALGRSQDILALIDDEKVPRHHREALLSSLLTALPEHPEVDIGPVHERLLQLATSRDLASLARYYVARRAFEQADDLIARLPSGFARGVLEAMAIAKARAGDPEGAFSDWQRVSFRPPAAAAWAEIAKAFLRAGKVAKARGLLPELRTPGRQIEVSAGLVEVAYETGQTDIGRDLLDEVFSLADTHYRASEAAQQLIDLAERLKHLDASAVSQDVLDRAVSLLRRSQGLDNDANSRALDQIAAAEAQVFASQGRFAEARRQAESIVQSFTRNSTFKAIAAAEARGDWVDQSAGAGRVIDNTATRIDILLDLARVHRKSESPEAAGAHVAEAMQIALVSRCEYDIFRVLPEFARIGRAKHVVAWLAHLQAQRPAQLRVLGAAALAQLEVGNRAGARSTLGWAIDVLEGRDPRTGDLSEAESAVRALAARAEHVATQRQRGCRSVVRVLDQYAPEVGPLLTLAQTAATLDDPRVERLFETAAKVAGRAGHPDVRHLLLGEVAVAETRAGRLRRACERLDRITSEAIWTHTLIDMALASWKHSGGR